MSNQAASLLEFPTAFPIKVMGLNQPGFREAVLELARRHDPMLDTSSIEERHSGQARYLGLTLTIQATSREQLDALYRDLSAHPLVKVVL